MISTGAGGKPAFAAVCVSAVRLSVAESGAPPPISNRPPQVHNPVGDVEKPRGGDSGEDAHAAELRAPQPAQILAGDAVELAERLEKRRLE